MACAADADDLTRYLRVSTVRTLHIRTVIYLHTRTHTHTRAICTRRTRTHTYDMRITYGTGGWLPVAAGEHGGGPGTTAPTLDHATEEEAYFHLAPAFIFLLLLLLLRTPIRSPPPFAATSSLTPVTFRSAWHRPRVDSLILLDHVTGL